MGLRSKRVFAQALDTVIYFLILVGFNIPFLLLVSTIIDDASDIILPIQGVYLSLVFFIIQTFQLYKTGSTLGYKIMNLRIVNNDNTKLSLERSAIRVFLRLVYYAFSGFGALVIFHYVRVYLTGGERDPLDSLMRTKVIEN